MHLARQRAMRRKMQNAILCEPTAVAERLDVGFGRLTAEIDLALDGGEAIGHRAQFEGGFRQRHLAPELLDVGRAGKGCDRTQSALSDLVGPRLRTLCAALAEAGLPGAFDGLGALAVSVQQRISEADERLGRRALLRDLTQRLEARDRWQDGRRKPLDQPGRLGEIGPTAVRLACQQDLERQRGERTGRNENQLLAVDLLGGRFKQGLIEAVGAVQIERQWPARAGYALKTGAGGLGPVEPRRFIQAAAQDADGLRKLLFADRRGVPMHVRARDGPDKGEARRRGEQQQGLLRAQLLLNLRDGRRRFGDERGIACELRGDRTVEVLDLVRDGRGLGAKGLFGLYVARGAWL